jgi:hypothetical protein
MCSEARRPVKVDNSADQNDCNNVQIGKSLAHIRFLGIIRLGVTVKSFFFQELILEFVTYRLSDL